MKVACLWHMAVVMVSHCAVLCCALCPVCVLSTNCTTPFPSQSFVQILGASVYKPTSAVIQTIKYISREVRDFRPPLRSR